MGLSRAEVVAEAMMREWRALARLTGQPSEPLMRDTREVILTLVAENLLAEMVSAIIVDDGIDERLTAVQRWSLAPAKPLLQPFWPVTRLGGHSRQFVIRLKLREKWFELPGSVRHAVCGSLPLGLVSPEGALEVDAGMNAVKAWKLPDGYYLVLETQLHPRSICHRNLSGL